MTTSNSRLDRWARLTDLPLIGAASAFLVVLLVPLYRASLTGAERTTLRTANALLWAIFAIDYVVRIHLSPERWRYVRTHLPDLLLLVVPFLRPLRLLRVIGLLGSAGRRVGERRLLTMTSYVVAGILLLIVVAGGFVLDAERDAAGANIQSPADALWWAATTVTTVGYGDRYPVTGEGRVVTVVLMVGGVALLGVVTAAIAAWFVGRFSQLDAVEVELQADADATARSLAEVVARLERIERALEQRGV